MAFKLNNDISKITNRQTAVAENIVQTVSKILADIKETGDTALRKYIAELDGYTGTNLLVTQEEIADGVQNAGVDFCRILKRAKQQLEDFHTHQQEKSWSMYKENGAILGQIVRPIARVALYVPGGTAAYPSTVLMNAVPAQIAGVKDIAIFTPVKSDGRVPDVILAAAFVCGISKIYKIGGAQAIAAAAYGTETVGKVDKIVGPGNAYVATAKQLVYGVVDIDMIAGPSEILIIADETATPRYIAADMLSQAEHDEMASSILVSTSQSVIDATEIELAKQLNALPRKEIAEVSLQNYGAAVLARDLNHAFEISNGIAPEHLEILTVNPLEHLPKVQNAGSIFLGEYTPEPLGDYMSGTNHVLPTGGTAKFSSPLGVYDFVKYSAYSYYTKPAFDELVADVAKFATLEGLDAHANSVKVRETI